MDTELIKHYAFELHWHLPLHRFLLTGMVLFLVKKLCEDLQIDIEVESEYERGFMIQLLYPKV